MEDKLEISSLEHTWILDLDGTLVKHNGYKIDGYDTFLPGAKEFLDSIPQGDMIIILTSRTKEYRSLTKKFLCENNVRYNHIIFDIPYGERILLNDDKNSGLCMAYAIRNKRDSEINYNFKIRDDL